MSIRRLTNMRYVIVLLFDKKSADTIFRVFKRFKEKKISHKGLMYDLKIKPHITLSFYENLDVEIAKERLNKYCKNHNKFTIQFSSIGYFPVEKSVLFLNPKTNKELLDIQQEVFELFEDFETVESPKMWVPHCTLCMYLQKTKIAKAIDIVKEEIVITEKLPFYITGNSISIVEYEPFKYANFLYDFNLKE